MDRINALEREPNPGSTPPVGALQQASAAPPPSRNAATVQRSSADKRTLRRAEEIASNPNILDGFYEALQATGFAGEERAAKLVYLVLTSRYLDRPLAAAVKGPSSAGKSALVDRVLKFFPKSACIKLTGMSEKALAYGEYSLKHKVLVIAEASGLGSGVKAYLVRSLVSEGRIDYETVESGEGGLKPRRIEREGPTGLLVTTTEHRLDPELETRMLSIPIDDSREQTRAVLLAEARGGNETEKADLRAWRAFQQLVPGGSSVDVPFAEHLAEKIPPIATRLRRDFLALLTLIKAHALLHHATRKRDEQGRIVATLDDYRVVRGLVADLIAQGVEARVPRGVRQVVEYVRSQPTSASESITAMAKELDVHKGTASRWVKQAVDMGYLINDEKRPGKRAMLRPGEPLPRDQEVLPRPEELFDE